MCKRDRSQSCETEESNSELTGTFPCATSDSCNLRRATTSGSGSEATIAAVITEVQTHHKASINDLQLMPRFAVLDPCLTVGLPPQVTAQTGMDALCHAVEAYTNDTYNSDFERLMCSKAVRLIHESLLTAYEDGTNLQARQDMQELHFMRDAHLQEEVWVMFMQLAMRSAGSMECLTGL